MAQGRDWRGRFSSGGGGGVGRSLRQQTSGMTKGSVSVYRTPGQSRGIQKRSDKLVNSAVGMSNRRVGHPIRGSGGRVRVVQTGKYGGKGPLSADLSRGGPNRSAARAISRGQHTPGAYIVAYGPRG